MGGVELESAELGGELAVVVGGDGLGGPGEEGAGAVGVVEGRHEEGGVVEPEGGVGRDGLVLGHALEEVACFLWGLLVLLSIYYFRGRWEGLELTSWRPVLV